MLLMVAQISLGQNTYENTKNNLEVSRKMDKGIKNIIVGVVEGISVAEVFTLPAGSR